LNSASIRSIPTCDTYPESAYPREYIICRDVNKVTGSKAKAPFLKTKAKACQLNPRPGQGHSRTRPIISGIRNLTQK